MNHHFSNSSERPRQRRNRSSASSVKGATIITCGYCQNVFSAVPRNAVCLKCKRPANRPLAVPLMLLATVCLPAGLLTSLLLRRSRPYAASQAFLISLIGAVVCAALYFSLR